MGRLRRRIVQPSGLPRSPRRTAAAARNHDLTESELADAERDWNSAATAQSNLTATVEQHAGHLAA